MDVRQYKIPGDAEGFREIDPAVLPDEEVVPDQERDPADVIRGMAARIRELEARVRDASAEVDRYYERYGPLDAD